MNNKINIYGYNTISEAGFPDILCPVIFLKSCNMKCPYCLNSKLVSGNPEEVDIDGVILDMKKHNETQVLISGGEPCLSDYLEDVISFMNKKGFDVLLSTNGSYPDVVERLIKNKKIVFFAVDVKSGFGDRSKWKLISSNLGIADDVLRTINIVSNSGIKHEFRTTLYPPLVDKNDIISISETLNKKSTWILQQFRKNNRLLNEKSVKNVQPYSESKLNDFVQLAKKNINNVNLRYT